MCCQTSTLCSSPKSLPKRKSKLHPSPSVLLVFGRLAFSYNRCFKHHLVVKGILSLALFAFDVSLNKQGRTLVYPWEDAVSHELAILVPVCTILFLARVKVAVVSVYEQNSEIDAIVVGQRVLPYRTNCQRNKRKKQECESQHRSLCFNANKQKASFSHPANTMKRP